jgi:hypothetical protein
MQTAVDAQAAEILKLAADAKEQGQGFLELQLEVGTAQQRSNISGTGVYSHREAKTYVGLLSGVEQIGWHLEHVTYVFTPTHQKTTRRSSAGRTRQSVES